jgi:hypothetical protein
MRIILLSLLAVSAAAALATASQASGDPRPRTGSAVKAAFRAHGIVLTRVSGTAMTRQELTDYSGNTFLALDVYPTVRAAVRALSQPWYTVRVTCSPEGGCGPTGAPRRVRVRNVIAQWYGDRLAVRRALLVLR